MTGLGSSCGACKFLRRKCSNECVFAPYFCYEQAANHFAAVHKVFGASNVSKLLLHLPLHTRSDAAITISYEALARIRDPVYGCVAHIFALQEQVANLQEEIEVLGTQMANLASPLFWHNAGLQTQHGLNYEAMNLQFYQNLQQQVAPPGRDVDDHAVNSQLPVPMSFEDGDQQSYFSDSDSNFMEGLFQGVDHDIFTLYPWLSNGCNDHTR